MDSGVMRTTPLRCGSHDLQVYRADTPVDWRQGLAGRDLTETDGMLFTFESDVHLAFHMGGVPIPILIAFFAGDGTLVDVTWMGINAQPYRPNRPYRYALELVGHHATEAGTFALLPALMDGIALP
jgi:uncharacterized membrane protein (UPF0127 family)